MLAAILRDRLDLKNQLDELIRTQSQIIVDCFLIVKDIDFLSSTTHSKEIADILEGHPFFIRSGNYMWTILVLELNKLFDKKENYALEKTLNIALDNQKQIAWTKEEVFDDLGELRVKIKSEKIQNIVANLNYIRNKQSAHLDRNRLDKQVLIHVDEAKELLDLAQNIVSDTNIWLNGIQLGLDFEFLGLCEMTVMNLVAYNKIRE
jgi:AbiU2